MKTCGIVRVGAHGDLIMASSVLPALKEQGFHITVYTSARGEEVIRHDPHIDKIYVFTDDKIAAFGGMHKWCRQLAAEHDRFIDFSESVEGTFLALPWRVSHAWPQEMRHRHMNRNYLEHHHELAQVPLPPRSKFYATADEVAWAKREAHKMGSYVILWVLSGSALHKVWPHVDTVIYTMMHQRPDYHVVLVGDKDCQALEMGWRKHPRVHCKSGEWTMRETMTFACHAADMVVGPETGVLSAAGMEAVPKVVFLSHSSEENLTKHWQNCIALSQPESHIPCSKSACHRMHYDLEHCHQDKETTVSACMTAITAQACWNAMTWFFDQSLQEIA